MKGLVLGFTVLAVITAGTAQQVAAQSAASEQRPPVPRTPWGDPDLQGLWSYGTSTPLQRPLKYAGREWLTEEEVAAENLEWSTFATSERRSELTAQFDLSLNFNQVWWDLGASTGRTSLVTDPSDGRLPPRTASRQAYEATPEAKWLQAVDWGLAPADGPENYGLNARCIVERRVPITPSSDNNHVRILQSPGHVVILQEKIHDFRIIPVTDHSDVPDQVRQWLGVSRGRWDGDTLRRRDQEPPRPRGLFRVGRRPARRRAVHSARRRRHRVLLHGDRPEHLDAAVERAGAVARGRGADLRVRLPRGELQHAPHAAGSAGGRRTPLTRVTPNVLVDRGSF